ncbi:MAG: chromosome segregation protein SMC [Nanoarchaeota archaeon]|nr:chromosome segregation protein SMC [Nanoarchaeota archaeon]
MTTIKKMRLNGFKSFPKQTEVMYTSGFSVVIGPNGSGKSNLTDAVCFVLGKSSAKDMRAEKSANLIYNGGKKGKPSKQAEVSIWFDNSNEHFSVQEKEVKITRIVKPNGQSTYRINDQIRTRQEMIDFLNSAKIDPNGYNIILQGDIIRFTEMKPIERRKIIEEAAGISVYEDRKEKALGELERVERKVSDAGIILKERGANLRELKKERDQAINYRKVEEKIKSDKATYFTAHIKQKQDQKERIESGVKKQKEAIERINHKVSQILDEINAKKQEIQEINAKIELQGEKKQFELHKEIESIKEELIKSSMRTETCNNELIKLKQRNAQLQKDNGEIDRKIKQFEKEIGQSNLKKSGLDSQKESLMEEIETFTQSPRETSKISGLQKEVLLLSEKKSGLLRQQDKISFQLEEIDSKLSQITSSNTSELRKKFSEISKQLSGELLQNAEFAIKISSIREDLTKKNEELAKLRTRDIMFKEKSLSSLPVKKILESGISGVYNTIAELGEIEPKYSLALQTAAGSRLNGIVVKDDNVAEKCIQYLKRTKIGSAIFFPLNKIRPSSISRELTHLEKLPGVEGFAINLVKFDQVFKDVFSYALGSTLIVDNIPTARKIGIGKIRMVSLEGDLMETSGAMIGGYKRLKQSFKEKGVEISMTKLESEVTSLDFLLSKLLNDRDINEQKIQELKQRKSDFEIQIIRSEKTSSVFDSNQLKKQKAELTNSLQEVSAKLRQVTQKLQVSSKELERASQLSSEEASGFLELKELQKSLQEVAIEQTNMGSNINTLKIQISMMQTEKNKIDSIVKTNNKSFEDFQKESLILADSIKKQRQDLKEKEKQEKEFYAQFKNMFNQRNKLNESINEKEISNAKYEEQIKTIEDKTNTLSIDRARIIGELEGLQEELEPYKNEKIRQGISIPELKVEIQNQERILKNMGNVNLKALEVYEKIEEEYNKLTSKIETLIREKQDVLDMMTEIESNKEELFMKTFDSISENFGRIFGFISTKGASAHLELEDKSQIFEGGVDIKVRIKGNRFLDIRSLSGGEKTLTALAFIFSIQEYSPSSFYLLDEVDAALDKANSEKLSKLIAQYSKNAQYIVISHNDAIITEADQVYGISMQEGISKIISLKI